MDVSDKAGLRQAMLQRRDALPRNFQKSAAGAIANRLFAREELRQPCAVGLYWSVRGEVPTREILDRMWREGYGVFLPRLGAAGLEFARVQDEGSLSPGPYGILAPMPECAAADIKTVSLLVVPGVAFDLHGGRLGWGKGYFDRVLRGYRGRRMALAYDFQVLEKIPTEDWDEGVEVILTEQRAIDVMSR